ncbi:RAB6-interacting golgin [Perilla frutescens var. hirtella]|uniref:RAB6-interacting golgin n=1 Tax=Perilla frutescens var. hirtella TaxID=608512 RepID=A0AAD4PDV1_PERFH|nr:RAB6-interacting golgin [Perilla frutescens var. hirtella]
MTTQKQQTLELHQQPEMLRIKNSGMISHVGSPLLNEERDEEMTRSALAAFRAKEEEIERRKIEVRDKVQAQLGRVEEETKRLAEIREELESLHDPMRKEVGIVRKRIDIINRDLKPMGLSCQKKEKEYKEALEAFNEKNREKGQLIARLVELVTESEKVRLKKLEELSKNIDSLH